MSTTELSTPVQRSSSAPSRRLDGQAALIGLSLFVVSMGTLAPESSPDAGSVTAEEIRRYAHDNAATLRLNTVASLIGIGLLVYFVSALRQRVRLPQQGSTASNAMLSLSAVIAAQSLHLTAVNSIFAVPSQLAQVSDEGVVTFYQISAAAEWLYTLTVASAGMLLVATYSWLALHLRLMARAVAWAGFALAAVGLATVVSIFIPEPTLDPFVIVLFGWWIWPLAVGSALGVRWLRTR